MLIQKKKENLKRPISIKEIESIIKLPKFKEPDTDEYTIKAYQTFKNEQN
jgi:hypothetical protein